ncbi:DUF4168 domain-containing protein [Geminocystis sp. NIES-3709]|uniref:DUF4168 domain-containing protein n=1 Tax=Geminocystis sp. NIES-3709 TaxID=1617448 RepID=UPI0005FC7A58|nr:DUF4168 domain-containing protein [Geminocystis sp. NIES-3709]BAQ66804.1 hypothetical protein GM3709_3569 [Geminocystis sp. NIES-3709]
MLVNHYNFLKIAYQGLIVFGFSTTAIVSGIIPEINIHTQTVTFSNHAMAENISDADLKKYAQAAMEIERIRKTTFENIESIVGKSKPSQLNCYQEDSLNQLPNNARTMALSYCQQSEEIVKKYGLTINQFNQITQQIKQNPTVKQKLQAIIGQM